jgi:DNA-directed RNA polymerase
MSEFLKVENPFIEPLFEEFYVVKEKQNSIQYKFEGTNEQRFVLLVDKDLNDNEMNLLSNIIQAGLKLNLNEMALLNINKQDEGATISDVIISLKPLKIIIWGCNEWVKKEGWGLALHQMANVRSTKILKADELLNYENNKDLKLQLWNLGIKKMIG